MDINNTIANEMTREKLISYRDGYDEAKKKYSFWCTLIGFYAGALYIIVNLMLTFNKRWKLIK